MRQRSRFNASELLEALRNRDPDAWRAFYEEQWRPLYTFVRARLSQSANAQADSEEVAQEVPCHASTGTIRFRCEALVETWLQSIAQYAIIDAMRAARRDRRLSEGTAALDRVCEALHSQAISDPEASALGQDMRRHLLRELHKVLGRHGGLVVKRHLEDLSEREVAAAQGLKCGTASGYLARARRRIRQQGSAVHEMKDARDFLQMQAQRRKVFSRAVLVGVLAGVLAVAFRWALDGSELLRTHLILWAHRHPTWGWLVPVSVGAVGAGIAVRLVSQVAPEAAGSGIPHLKAVLYRLRSMRWQRIVPVKFMAGVFAIGGGLTLGREGPTVQMGGAVGAAVAERLKESPRERQTLIAAGAGAGLAAAFNAPLAGLTFVLEEVQRDFTPMVFAASFLASVTADVVTRSLTDQLPIFHVTAYPVPPLVTLPAFLVLGGLTGLLGVAFNRGLLSTLEGFARLGSWLSRLGGWPLRLAGAGVGAVVGLVGWFVPQALGGGHSLVEAVLAGQMALTLVPLWFLLRFGLTMLSYGCGAAGGIFAPLLVLGALIGLGVGEVTHLVMPGAVNYPEAFAVVGMAAYFTAIVRAPLTGIVLIVEMTNSYAQMLPLLVACFSAYAVADALGDRPIYEALLERDVRRDGAAPALQGTLILELTVQAHSRFDGKRVRDLGLPPGSILVTRRHGIHESVPMADTCLEAGDRITAVIAPEAATAAILLRQGCEAPHTAGPGA